MNKILKTILNLLYVIISGYIFSYIPRKAIETLEAKMEVAANRAKQSLMARFIF